MNQLRGESILRLPERDVEVGVHARIVRVQVENALTALTWLVVNGELREEDRRDAFQAEACVVALARRRGMSAPLVSEEGPREHAVNALTALEVFRQVYAAGSWWDCLNLPTLRSADLAALLEAVEVRLRLVVKAL